MKNVVLVDESGAGLLALILRNFITELAQRGDPGMDSKLGSLSGTVEIRADRMAVHIVFGDAVEILSGIEPGTRVAISPLEKLVDGARVEVRK